MKEVKKQAKITIINSVNITKTAVRRFFWYDQKK